MTIPSSLQRIALNGLDLWRRFYAHALAPLAIFSVGLFAFFQIPDDTDQLIFFSFAFLLAYAVYVELRDLDIHKPIFAAFAAAFIFLFLFEQADTTLIPETSILRNSMNVLTDVHFHLYVLAATAGVVTVFIYRFELREQSLLEDEVKTVSRENKTLYGPHRQRRSAQISSFLLSKLENEGWFWLLCVAALSITGLLLRLEQISDMGQGIDGYYHLLDARHYLAHGEFVYKRAQFFSALIAMSYALFGESIASAYLPNIFVSVLSIPLSYVVGRRYVGRLGGMITALLLTTSFWHIGDMANLRMYPLFCFLTLLIFWLVPVLLDVRRDQDVKATVKRYGLLLAILIGLFALGFHVHKLTASLVPIFVFFLILTTGASVIQDIREKHISAKTKIISSFLGTVLAIGVFLYIKQPSLVTSALRWDPVLFQEWDTYAGQIRTSLGWLLSLFGHQTIYLFLIIYLALCLARQKITSSIPWIFFVGIWFMSAFLFTREYFAPRYIVFTLPFLFMVIGGVIAITSRQFFQQRALQVILSLCLVILLVPWSRTEIVVNEKLGETELQELYYAFNDVVSQIPVRESDGMIDTSTGALAYHQSTVDDIVYIRSIDDRGSGRPIPTTVLENRFLSTVRTHEHGWFLTDIYRFQHWDCDVTVPCSIRSLVDEHPEVFYTHTYPEDDQLLLIEWDHSWSPGIIDSLAFPALSDEVL